MDMVMDLTTFIDKTVSVVRSIEKDIMMLLDTCK